MTIAAGFKCDDGYLLAADTLVSVPGYYKLAQSKIKKIAVPACRAFFAIAGDVEFTNRGLEIIDLHLKQADANIESVKNALDLGCLEVWEKYASLQADLPNLYLQMIGTISITGHPTEFIKVSGPVISPAGDYSCIGSGEALATFLITSAFAPCMPRDIAVRLAANIPFHVKRNVDGCGGVSQFLHVSRDGGWHYPFYDDGGFEALSDLEQVLSRLDRVLRGIIPQFVNYTIDKNTFADAMKLLGDRVGEIRELHIKTISDKEQKYINWQIEQAESDAQEQ